MKTSIYTLIKSISILVIIQNILCWFTWLICDAFGIYSSIYYIDIENLPPLKKEWEEELYNFLYYLLSTFISISIFWGVSFVINSIIYLKYRNFYSILSILLASFLYTYIIFIFLLDIYFWNELFKLLYSITIFCSILLIKKHI